MANTITNFLVGLGFDFDKKGADQIDSSIDSIKSSALQLGAVVAGAFGIKALTADFAAANDTLGKFSNVLGVNANDVNAFGNALAHEGGSLQSYMQQLQNIEQLRAGLLQGDAEFIALAGRAGIDTTELVNAADATQAYLSLADQFANLSQQQRINAASALGLDEASIRLLSKGRAEVVRITDEQRKLRPVTEQMTKTAADFNDEMQDLSNNIGRQADRISSALLPEVNNLIGSLNGWFNANDDIINQKLDTALKPIAENFETLAVTGGLLATSGLLSTFAGLAGYVPVVGSGLAAVATSLSTIVSVGAAGAVGYSIGSVIEPYIPQDIREDIGEGVARSLAFFGSEEARSALNAQGVDQRRGGEIIEGLFTPRPSNPLSQPSSSRMTTGERSPYEDLPPGTVLRGGDSRPINVQLMLDGNVIDQRIIDVNERQNERAIEDLSSNVER